jgi:hypothetical protein
LRIAVSILATRRIPSIEFLLPCTMSISESPEDSGIDTLHPQKNRLAAREFGTHHLAAALFPAEKWIQLEPGIYAAKSRLGGSHKEQAKLYREISDVRILTARGSVVYFLPEQANTEEIGKKYPDTIIDGAVVELKTISGNRTTLGKSFKRGYKQGFSLLAAHPELSTEHDVFLRLYTPFTIESIRAKLAGELKNTTSQGRCICFFEATKELYSWSYAELRAIIGV